MSLVDEFISKLSPQDQKQAINIISDLHETFEDLKKRVLSSRYPFATSSTFNKQHQYLLNKGFIERVSRSIYRVTEKGQKYLEILS